MKLLLENWRQYLVESEKVQDYGYLYLFEGDTVRQTSFYDALSLLNENENAVETFLESWERSVDYQIEQLDEGALADVANNPVLYLSTQAFVLLDRLKGNAVKYAGKILGVVNKVRGLLARIEEKNPILYKVGANATKIIVAMLVVYTMSHIFGGGEAQAGDILSASQFEGGEIVQKVVASEEQLRHIGEAAKQTEGLQEIGQELLNIANSPQDVEGGVGSSISSMAQRAIEHGLKQMAENSSAAKTLVDAAKNAAQSTRVPVDALQATLSDPEVAARAKEAADVARQAGLNETPT